jgi:phage gp46-like protein
MTQDFAASQSNGGVFDIIINEATKRFEEISGMETAFDFQLFVDRRASRSEISEARQRQGWIGDLETKQRGFEVGSLIYLKRQSRNTQVDKNEMAAYAEDALSYLVSIGAAERVTARVVGDNIEGEIRVRADDVNRYTRLWRETGGA